MSACYGPKVEDEERDDAKLNYCCDSNRQDRAERRCGGETRSAMRDEPSEKDP
jgi:hypothetical protein